MKPNSTRRRLGRPKGTGSQQAYETLRRRILRLELPPGADIDEKALVQEVFQGRSIRGLVRGVDCRIMTLAATPVIMNPQGTASFLAVSDNAIRAIRACEPFNLPPTKYEIWKEMVLNFDSRDKF